MAHPKPDVLSRTQITILSAADTATSPWKATALRTTLSARTIPDYQALHDCSRSRSSRQPQATVRPGGESARRLGGSRAARAGFPESAVFPRGPAACARGGVRGRSSRTSMRFSRNCGLRGDRDGTPQARGCSAPRSHDSLVDAGRVRRQHSRALLHQGGRRRRVCDWQRGPDVLVSGKTQFSSYLNNKNNRYEEAIGEATTSVTAIRSPRWATPTSFGQRLRGGASSCSATSWFACAPDGPFDATMLLVANWDDATLTGADRGSSADACDAAILRTSARRSDDLHAGRHPP